MAKAFALCIKHILPKIILLEQTRFICGQYILDNFIPVWEGIEWAHSTDLNTLFVKIDFQKTYDWVKWPFILGMLKALDFDPTFIGSVETIFVDAPASLSINRSKS